MFEETRTDFRDLDHAVEPKSYLDTIFSISGKYIDRMLSREEKEKLRRDCLYLAGKNVQEIVKGFSHNYERS